MKGWTAVVALLAMAAMAVAVAQTPRSNTAVERFKRQTGHPAGWPGHVVDHRIPLCAGGANDPNNMQWQPLAESYRKDGFERQLCAEMVRQGYTIVRLTKGAVK